MMRNPVSRRHRAPLWATAGLALLVGLAACTPAEPGPTTSAATTTSPSATPGASTTQTPSGGGELPDLTEDQYPAEVGAWKLERPMGQYVYNNGATRIGITYTSRDFPVEGVAPEASQVLPEVKCDNSIGWIVCYAELPTQERRMICNDMGSETDMKKFATACKEIVEGFGEV